MATRTWLQSRPDYGLGFQVKVCETLRVVPAAKRNGAQVGEVAAPRRGVPVRFSRPLSSKQGTPSYVFFGRETCLFATRRAERASLMVPPASARSARRSASSLPHTQPHHL